MAFFSFLFSQKSSIVDAWQGSTYTSVNLRKLDIVKDDDEDLDELFVWFGWRTKGVFTLFPAETIVRDPHHRESTTRCGWTWEDLNFHKT